MAGAGVGLVYVATNRPVSVDLVAATGEQQAPLVGTSLATRVAQTCPGPELAGIPGIPDVPVTSSLTASAGPGRAPPRPGARQWSARRHLRLDHVALPRRAPGQRRDAGAEHDGRDGIRRRADPAHRRGIDGTGRGGHPGVAGRQQGPARPGDHALRRRWLRPVAARRRRRPRPPGTAHPHQPRRQPGDHRRHRARRLPVSSATPSSRPCRPGGRVSVLLDARYGEEEHPAVHVRSDGGGVQATLTDTWVNGSTALGAETTVAAAAPATVAGGAGSRRRPDRFDLGPGGRARRPGRRRPGQRAQP